MVLQGKEARYGKRVSFKYGTFADYLHQPNYIYMRPIFGVGTGIFFDWNNNFVEENKFLGYGDRNILFVLDVYSCHVSFKIISFLRNNGIVFACIPAHTSHILHPLNVGVFCPLNEEFRKLLSRKKVSSTKDTRNNIFTICKILCKAYRKYVIAPNVITGFRRTSLWNNEKKDCDPEQIRPEDFMPSTVRPECLSAARMTRNVQSILYCCNNPQQRIETHRQLVNLFKKRQEELVSDGIIVENGTVALSQTTGATFTSDKAINFLNNRQLQHQQEQ